MVTSAALAVYLVELLKKLFRMITKNPLFEFSPKVMAALLVATNAAAVLILAVLGQSGYQLPTDWTAWAKTLLLAVVGALVSSALYVVGYAPFRQFYHEFYAGLKAKVKKVK